MRLRALALAAVAAALLAGLPAGASAGFVAETINVSGDLAETDLFPTTSADGAGRVTAVWQERIAGQRHVVARRINADGTLGPRLVVSDGTMIPIQREVASTAAGRSIVIWSESTTGTAPRFLRGRWIEADDTMGAQFVIRNAGVAFGADSPAVTTTTTGNAVAVWRNDASVPAYQIETRLISAAGLLGTLHQITVGPSQTVPGVAADAAGGAVVAWNGGGTLQTVPIDSSGAAGTIQTPVAAGVFGGIALASDALARFRAVWTTVAQADSAATLALDAAGVAVGTAQSLDTIGTADFARVAYGVDGRSLAMWTRAGGGGVVSRLVGADGVPAGQSFTSPPGTDNQFSQNVGLLSDGTGILLWNQGPSAQPRSLRGRVIGPDGAAGDPVTFAPGNAGSASVHPTTPGAGLVVWEQRDGGTTGPSAVVARRFAPPPVCADVQATVVQGRPVDVAVACAGLGLTAVEIVTGPARGAAQVTGPATVRYTPRPGVDGTDTVTFRGSGAGGVGAAATLAISVGRDTVAPVIRRFALSRRAIPLATAFRVRPARRPTFVVRVGEPATLAITVQRRVGTRWRTIGVLRRTVATRVASVKLGRRVGTKALKPGRHRARLRATDAAGNRSTLRTVRFTVSAG